MTIIPQCFACLQLGPPSGRMTCSAFPSGIPEPILLAEHDHREPWPGDRGIRFEPANDETPFSEARGADGDQR